MHRNCRKSWLDWVECQNRTVQIDIIKATDCSAGRYQRQPYVCEAKQISKTALAIASFYHSIVHAGHWWNIYSRRIENVRTMKMCGKDEARSQLPFAFDLFEWGSKQKRRKIQLHGFVCTPITIPHTQLNVHGCGDETNNVVISLGKGPVNALNHNVCICFDSRSKHTPRNHIMYNVHRLLDLVARWMQFLLQYLFCRLAAIWFRFKWTPDDWEGFGTVSLRRLLFWPLKCVCCLARFTWFDWLLSYYHFDRCFCETSTVSQSQHLYNLIQIKYFKVNKNEIALFRFGFCTFCCISLSIQFYRFSV